MFPVTKSLLVWLCLAFTSSASLASSCDTWPAGMVVVGLTDDGWSMFVSEEEGQFLKKISIDDEARNPVYSPKTREIYYIDQTGSVKSFSLEHKKESVLYNTTGGDSFTQPEYDSERDALYLVQLKQGNSVDTDIVRLGLNRPELEGAQQHKGELDPIVFHRSAQFEPYLSRSWLYYSSVHCVVGCGHIIQEIWRYNLASGAAEQLTLLGGISRQPAVDENEKWLYFSSNKNGNYHIFRQSLLNDRVEQLTDGLVTDQSPAPYKESLLFIRSDEQGSRIVCLDNNGKLHEKDMKPQVTALRDLEIR